MDRVKLKLPIVGDTWIKFQVAQFCRTLSTLLAGGTPLVAASPRPPIPSEPADFRQHCASASELVREGQSLHAALGARD